MLPVSIASFFLFRKQFLLVEYVIMYLLSCGVKSCGLLSPFSVFAQRDESVLNMLILLFIVANC